MNYTLACAQFTATNQLTNNLKSCKILVEKAKQNNVKALFFPEASDFISLNKQQAFDLAETLDGDFVKNIKQVAKVNDIWIGIGVHEKIEISNKLYNTYIMISNEGELVAKYRKMHLFDISIPNGPNLKESDYTLAGDKISPILETPFGKVGLAICYDLRFPELSQTLRIKGAEIIIYPSVFTVKTGLAHWEPLLRARAIETQCYVIAPAQIGQHNEKRKSYGNSMIIDPWGQIVSNCKNELNTIGCATIDLDYLKNIRQQMPLISHCRDDLYYK